MKELINASQTTFCDLEKHLRETIELQKEVINLLTDKVQKLTENKKTDAKSN